MKVAIVGFDREGRASYEYYSRLNADITVCDIKTDISVPSGTSSQLGDTYLDNLDRFDVIVRTPGLNAEKILEHNPSVAKKITTGTNLFFENSPTKNIIGITGTKGKGTTSTLTAEILRESGKTVHLGGNIGIPALGLLASIESDDWVVLELSSYQLSDLKYSPHIAACLMIANDHLIWHGDFDEYTEAKSNLFKHQTKNDIAIYYGMNEHSRSIAGESQGTLLPYFEAPGAEIEDGMVRIHGKNICKIEEIKLIGEHNLQNVCAAVTVAWQIAQDTDAIAKALLGFAGLPHRLERVATINDITFYNDSFASNPDAAIAALKAISGSKVLLIGGYDRKLPVGELLAEVKEHQVNGDVKTAVFYGASSDRLVECAEELKIDYLASDKDFKNTVMQAVNLAEAGDAILLSPGFASFDMFKDFEDRGEQFKRIVKEML